MSDLESKIILSPAEGSTHPLACSQAVSTPWDQLTLATVHLQASACLSHLLERTSFVLLANLHPPSKSTASTCFSSNFFSTASPFKLCQACPLFWHHHLHTCYNALQVYLYLYSVNSLRAGNVPDSFLNLLIT